MRKLKGFLVSGLIIAAIALINPLTVLRVNGDSMESTVFEGDIVLAVSGLPLSRGSLIVFNHDGQKFLKRVVGRGGDVVEIRDTELYVNDEHIQESYVDHADSDGQFFGPITVKNGQLFVLGDNRRWSIDSRTFGSINETSVIGVVVIGQQGGVR